MNSVLALCRARKRRQSTEGSGACRTVRAPSPSPAWLPHCAPRMPRSRACLLVPCHAQCKAEAAAWDRREGTDGSGLKIRVPSTLQLLRASVSSSAAGPHLPTVLRNRGFPRPLRTECANSHLPPRDLANGSHMLGFQKPGCSDRHRSPSGNLPLCLTAEGTGSQTAPGGPSGSHCRFLKSPPAAPCPNHAACPFHRPSMCHSRSRAVQRHKTTLL